MTVLDNIPFSDILPVRLDTGRASPNVYALVLPPLVADWLLASLYDDKGVYVGRSVLSKRILLEAGLRRHWNPATMVLVTGGTVPGEEMRLMLPVISYDGLPEHEVLGILRGALDVAEHRAQRCKWYHVRPDKRRKVLRYVMKVFTVPTLGKALFRRVVDVWLEAGGCESEL